MKTLDDNSVNSAQDQLTKTIKSKAITLFLSEVKHQSIDEGIELNARMFDFMAALPANTDLEAAYKAETGFELMVHNGYKTMKADRLIMELKDYFCACASIYDFEFDLNISASPL
ncbi:hypothetical protein V6380_16880 [Acinetobacter variabilis]|uniref:hypothetical protein n=1 Tax=Acinetobacter variabilis TaxID=70346 RepID=UPI003B83F2BF